MSPASNVSSDKYAVLVVDDEEDIRDILRRTVESAGIQCSVAASTEEAKTLLAETPVDVVITDIVMPGSSGIELLEFVRSTYTADVIVMTGFAKGLKYEEIIEKGACDFIRKPLSPKEVLIRLKRVLRERFIIGERNRTENELQQSYFALRRILDDTVNALGAALGQRDPYTAGHQKRVARLACAIAGGMGLPEDAIEGLHMAGLLHDIGKISVPAEILNKPTVLSDIEMSLIKEHPSFGYDILKDIGFRQPVADIVLQHHERLNGSGYPKGLSGKAILREARILAVADTVEAITSHRPYRPGLGVDAALEEINTKSGILYDAEAAGTCDVLFRKKGYTFRYDE